MKETGYIGLPPVMYRASAFNMIPDFVSSSDILHSHLHQSLSKYLGFEFSKQMDS